MGTALLNGVLVGASIVATRFVVDQTGPASLALLRYAIGLACLLPPALLTAHVRFERGDLLPIALLGILQFGVVVGLLNFALQFIPSGRASLIFATAPLLTMLLAALLGHERILPVKAIGVGLTILGVGLALGDKVLGAGAASNGWIGELAVFGSAFSAALCSVLYRRYLARYPAVSVSAVAMFASLLFLAYFAAGEGLFASFPHITEVGWLAIVFMGVGSGLGYYLWLWALSRTTPTRVTVFLAFSPLTATFLGALLLAEAVSAAALVGLAAVVTGLVLVHWQRG